MAIWYATTITTSFIDGSTGAYFNDQDHVTGLITAGSWSIWDKSSLNFPDQQDRTVKACSPIDISTIIVNTGSAMQGTTEYEVFYEPGGKNPMKAGEKISSGMIQPIPEGGTDKIIFNATQPGAYKFKALQRPGHGNKEDTRHDLWSETITIKCEQATPKAPDPDKGGDESKPEPPEKIEKKEAQEVSEPGTATDQSKENNKEETPPKEEEKQKPEQPADPADPEPQVEEQPEVTDASVQDSEPPPAKEEEQVEPSPATPDKTSNQE